MSDMEAQLNQALQKYIKHIQEGSEAATDAQGKAQPWLVAQTDQFGAEANSVLDTFIQAARDHRAEGGECCKHIPFCPGIEVMLAIASLSEVSLSHALGALTAAITRLADADR